MTETDDEDFTPPPPRSRFRWARRLALWCLGFIAVVVLVAFVSRWQVGRMGQRQLNTSTARLDNEDPTWRLDAIVAERKKNEPTEKQNASPEVLKLAERIPQDFRDWQKSEEAVRWRPRHPNNRLPPVDAIIHARTVAAPTLFVRVEALKLRDKQAGFYPLTIAADPIATSLPHLDKARQVVALLQFDGEFTALDGNPNRGVSSARAALGVARSISDEPLLISQLVRIACAKVAAQTAMQVLAWSEPTEGLAELQTELLAEADVPWFRYGMRGERAMLDKVFQGLDDGTIPPENWFRYADIHNPGPQHYTAFHAYRPLIPGDRAKTLELSTRYLEAAKLPHHEQLAALKAIPIPKGPPDEFRYVITRLLLPACEKIAEAGLRTRADLLSAATCVACERFRRKNARWPRDLAELTPAILHAVPLNPFDGKPVAYRVFPDRVAVYCFWANERMKHEGPDDFREGDMPGIGIGYRVWNPNQRGLPAEEKRDP